MGIGKKTSQPEGTDGGMRAIGIDPDDPIINESLNDAALNALKQPENMEKWLKESTWKQPKWLKQTTSEKPKKMGFQGYYLNSLRARYMHLEGDFRTAYNNFYGTKYMDLVTARRIIDYLQISREALENDDCDVNDVITLLDLADQYMVWIYPPHHAKAQALGLASDLRGQGNPWGVYLENEASRDGQTLGGLRAALDKTKEAMNQAKQAALISTGLQIERLNAAKKWSWYILIVSIAVLPLAIRTPNVEVAGATNATGEAVTIWANSILGTIIPQLRPWFAVVCAAIFGAGGAFLSGLMSVQRTRTVLNDYQENLKSNQLKLNVGALAAAIVFVFLTWDIIPGVKMDSLGSLVFLSFIAGFSEKYFLNLLNINSDEIAPRPAPVNLQQTAKIPPAADAAPADVSEAELDKPQDAPEPAEKVENTEGGEDVNNRRIN
ncbi:MAG: hypothetical protein JNL70_06360 [Saprospiraceae bacterium]|nr:hypothetical protein [Saprospiraceae bacterium]